MLRYKDPFSLAALFHRNSEPWNNLEAYEDAHARMVEFKSVGPREDRIALPAARSSPFTLLLARRASCRVFAARDLSVEELAAVLGAAYGVTGRRSSVEGRTLTRAVPSGGARYPLELYVAADRVAGVPRGLYHFHARDNVLEPLGTSCSIAELIPDLMNQHYLENAGALVFMAAVFPRTLLKYGARGYRYVLIEAGHVAQNICLLAAERGLGALCIGGFTDQRINRRFQLDERTEAMVYALAVGHNEIFVTSP